jgi:hypothetical protein
MSVIIDGSNGSISSGSLSVNLSNRGITSASMPAGSILQVVQTVLTSTASYTANGTEQQVTGLAASITPTSSTSKILILLNFNYGSTGTTYGGYFKRNGTSIGIGDAGSSQQRVGFGMALSSDTNQVNSFYYQYLDSPASTSSVAYTFFVNNDNTNPIYINRSVNDANNNTGKRCISSVTLMEIAS